jgi:hypothetical protein
MNRLALLGDSILDNGPYVKPEPDTADHLQRSLGAAWSLDLLARDGSTIADLRFQLAEVASDTDVAVLSVGGNDAVEHIGLLDPKPTTNTKLLADVAAMSEGFATAYDPLLEDLQGRVRRLLVCTIYEPPLIDETTARLARVPLAVLNDQIIRVAARRGLDILDLRAVCTEPADFVKEIEPSPRGAHKIALAIANAIQPALGKAGVRFFAV